MFYLSDFIGDGAETNPYRPPVDDYAIIDLRGEVLAQAGWCIVNSDNPPTGSQAFKLSEGLDDTPGLLAVQQLENSLGVTLANKTTTRAVITELLLVHGTIPTDKTKWNGLQTNKEGNHRIVIKGEVVFDAPTVKATTITDDFNRADSDTLGGPSWTWTETSGDIDIVNNQAEVQTVDGSGEARADSDLSTDDHYAQIDVVQWQGGGGAGSETTPGTMCRFASAARTFYHGRFNSFADEWQLYEVTTGSFTSIASTSDTQPTPLFTLKLEVNGSTVEIFHDTVSQLSTTDTVITGNTRTGMRGFQGVDVTTNIEFDDFEAADLAADTRFINSQLQSNRSLRVDADRLVSASGLLSARKVI